MSVARSKNGIKHLGLEARDGLGRYVEEGLINAGFLTQRCMFPQDAKDLATSDAIAM